MFDCLNPWRWMIHERRVMGYQDTGAWDNLPPGLWPVDEPEDNPGDSDAGENEPEEPGDEKGVIKEG